MKFYIKTFGCQMNVSDSEKMAGILKRAGYTPAGTPEEADVVIVNTCSVRAKPDNKAYSFIGKLSALKERKPFTLAVAGCIPQKESEELIKRYPKIDLIFGTYNFHRVDKLLERLNVRKPLIEVLQERTEDENVIPEIDQITTNPYVAYVTVQRGCNRFCTYCIVPFTRGRERSVPPELVVEEVKRLADKGVKEVHLLGQNVDFYGISLEKRVDLADLLYMVSKIEGIERIRFTTSHPAGFTKKIAEAIRDLPKVCEYVHLPPQSGSNRILKMMNRGYTREEYIEKVLMLRETVPNISISGDFIVGFPSETEKDFEDTLRLVETCIFDQAFVFEYSPRPLTRAYSFKDDVSKEEKNRRLRILSELLKQQAEERNIQRLGNVEEVLIEGESPKNRTKLIGRTRDNKVVIVDGHKELIGRFVKVKIEETSPYFLKGKPENVLTGVLDD